MEDNGERFPLSRFDLVGAVVVAFALLFAVSYAAQGDIRRAGIALGVTLLPIPLVEARRLVILCGLGVAVYRIVVVFGFTAVVHHPVWTAVFVVIVLLCLIRRPR